MVMCFLSTARSSVAVHCFEVSQPGSWLCQTRVWARTFWWFFRARFTIWSPSAQSKTPCYGSVAYHFMPLPGVIMSNSLSRMPCRRCR